MKWILNSKSWFFEFNTKMNTRKEVKGYVLKINAPKLSKPEIKQAKAYYKSKGYRLKTTDWHRYIKAINGKFNAKYIPDDIFKAIICRKFNQKRQWPALVDKNITYHLFSEFNQPVRVVQNINGFYYHNDKIISAKSAQTILNNIGKRMIIKPTIDSGKGENVNVFSVSENTTSIDDKSIEELLNYYGKDFIIQEFVSQSNDMKKLNPSTLNTIRIMTYLRDDNVISLSSVVRIGNPDSVTDNFSGGGIIVGIEPNGQLKPTGYCKKGSSYVKSHSGVMFESFMIPNYNKVLDMVKAMHIKVPYFKFVSWDIGIDKSDLPIFIEYNTYNQNSILHQIPNGPLFGEYTDEILALGLKS